MGIKKVANILTFMEQRKVYRLLVSLGERDEELARKIRKEMVTVHPPYVVVIPAKAGIQ